jgi:hypothetical protein
MISGRVLNLTPKTERDRYHVFHTEQSIHDFLQLFEAYSFHTQWSIPMSTGHRLNRRAFGRIAAIVLLFASTMFLFVGVQNQAIGAQSKITVPVFESGLLDTAIKAWLKGKKVPIIVQFSATPLPGTWQAFLSQVLQQAQQHSSDVKAAGATVKKSYVHIPAVSAMADAGTLLKFLLNPTVVRVSLDRQCMSHLATTAKAIGADQVWAGAPGLPPITGSGVTVAVVDSGVASDPDLNGRVIKT